MKGIFILILLLSASGVYAQVVLNGKIINYDRKATVSYIPTIDGIAAVLARTGKQITPNANGNFKIRVENKGLGTLRMYFAGLSFAFLHSDKAEINLVIDQDKIHFPTRKRSDFTADSVKQVATVSIDGDFAKVNRYYNRMVRSSFLTVTVEGGYHSRIVGKLTSHGQVISFIDSLSQIELKLINALSSEIDSEKSSPNPVTPEVKRFLENQVYAYYGSVFLSGMMLKRFEQSRKLSANPEAPRTVYNTKWEQLMEEFFAQSSRKLFPAASSFEYNEFIMNMAYAQDYYKRYHFDEVPLKTEDELVIEKLLHPKLHLLDSLSLLDEKTLLALKLHNLAGRFLYTQTYYSPVLLNTINELRGQYRGSPFFTLYEPEIEKLKLYLKTTSQKYDKAMIVETNYVQFRDLIDTFKGKNLFIDVWATWCGPCVDDFNYKSILKPFIDHGQITVLYVSIDKQVWKKKWMENMRFNQLEGHHVLADNVLIKDMWNYLGGREGFIPRYALIDKRGTVFLNDAARPSEGETLTLQIRDMLGRQ